MIWPAIDEMKTELLHFIRVYGGDKVTRLMVKHSEATLNQLPTWLSSADNVLTFFNNAIRNSAVIFPTVALNAVSYDSVTIPRYYQFSEAHKVTLETQIRKYFDNLKPFYAERRGRQSSILHLFQTMHRKSASLIQCMEVTAFLPELDEATRLLLAEYYLLRVWVFYTTLAQDPHMRGRERVDSRDGEDGEDGEDSEEEDQERDGVFAGNQKELKQKTAQWLVALLAMFQAEKDKVNVNSQHIQDRVFQLREKEKNSITDRLQAMTDEQRNVDNVMKTIKLGEYNKGLQKGLTMYDMNYYDNEQLLRDELVQTERAILQKHNMALESGLLDVFVEEYNAQQVADREMDDDAYDMDYINEDFYNGNTDGVGAPEEEPDDYQDYES